MEFSLLDGATSNPCRIGYVAGMGAHGMGAHVSSQLAQFRSQLTRFSHPKCYPDVGMAPPATLLQVLDTHEANVVARATHAICISAFGFFLHPKLLGVVCVEKSSRWWIMGRSASGQGCFVVLSFVFLSHTSRGQTLATRYW